MYQLKKLKLINWHFFLNTTIELEGHTLITGENGSGKSTVLDAVQYVLTGGKSKFNTAAHDMSQRNILGYVRCKTGDQNKQYERSGDISSHVALEFFDSVNNQSFIIGAVIDSPASLTTPDSVFYIIENTGIDDELFMSDSIPFNISGFKKALRGNYEFKLEPKQSLAQEMIRNRIGNVESRFFSMITKSLTFKAMKDVNDFVFNYLLEKKDLDIENLKENIAKYQEFEQILLTTKEEIKSLENIKNKYIQINDLTRSQEIEVHSTKLLNKMMIQERIKSKQLNLKEFESKLEKYATQYDNINKEIEEVKKEERTLRVALEKNNNFSIVSNIQSNLDSNNNELKSLEFKYEIWKKNLNSEISICKELAKIYDNPILFEFLNLANNVTREESIQKIPTIITQIYDFYQEELEKLIKRKSYLDEKKKEVADSIEVAKRRISQLENRRLNYPFEVETLLKVLKEELTKIYRVEVEPKVLCELLEITDDTWRNAVEGYLGMNKFNIIVEPKYFDAALKIYESEKRTRRIYNVGLVNTGKFLKEVNIVDNSLASVVNSPISYVKNYINNMIGTLMCCYDVNELKNYTRSITPSVMIYQNHTARSTDPNNYMRHYIGQSAYQSQMKSDNKSLQTFYTDYEKLLKETSNIDLIINLIKGSNLDDISINLTLNNEIERLKDKSRDYKVKLNEVDSSNFVVGQEQLDKIIDKLNKFEISKRVLEEEKIEVKSEIKIITHAIEENAQALSLIDKEIVKSKEFNLSIALKSEEKIAKLNTKSYEEYFNDFSRRINNFEIKIAELTDELKAMQLEYNHKYQFGSEIGLEAMENYNANYDRIKIDRLLAYEEKAIKARRNAEGQFKEQWLSKVRENIEEARRDLRKINNALRGVKFGQDEYEFKFTISQKHKEIYDLIMDDEALKQEVSFEDIGTKHLFAMDKIREIMFGSSIESSNELLDYRNYMEYDILIYNNGSIISFAKVCREKSGGETQTPYYVTIIASFIHLYKNAFPQTIGIILFDEAFDKMDDLRIDSMMQFITKLDLQVIIASPPQRMEDIAKYTSTTLVLIKNKNHVECQEIHRKRVHNIIA